MKYYFITYQAINKHGSVDYWNDVIEGSPMSFIKTTAKEEKASSGNHYAFVLTNTCKISKKEFNEWKDKF